MSHAATIPSAIGYETVMRLRLLLLLLLVGLLGCPPAVDDDDLPDDDDALDCDPVDAEPEAGPSGYPMDGWGWVSEGLLMEPADPGGGTDGYLSPAVVEIAGVLHLFVTHKSGTTHTLLHSASDTWGDWDTPQPVTGLDPDEMQAYPSVLFRNGLLRLWLGSGSVDHYTSTDGDDWTLVAEHVLTAGDTGDFDDLSLLYPSVVTDDAGYAMLYTGFDGAMFRIGRATSEDGVVWVKDDASPLIEPGAADEFDNHAVAQTALVRAGGSWRAWYGGYDTSETDPGPYRIGLATSDDGVSWNKAGVSLDLSADGDDAWSTRDPAVIHHDGAWRMVYTGMGTDARYRLMTATSTTCPSL